jgi:hypothetical protein
MVKSVLGKYVRSSHYKELYIQMQRAKHHLYNNSIHVRYFDHVLAMQAGRVARDANGYFIIYHNTPLREIERGIHNILFSKYTSKLFE